MRLVKTSDCIEHYRSKSGVAAALGIAAPSIYCWGDYPPPLRQLQIEGMTGGLLRAEPDCDKVRVSALAEAKA